MTTGKSNVSKTFSKQLAAYQQAIDEDIAQYVAYSLRSTQQQYGEHSRLAVEAFTKILQRGGKRIRGALAMYGYELCGGTNRPMILQAARAIEMVHAYVLIIDDIQDRSPMRRGGPAAHVALADYHRQHNLAGDPEHFGMSLALNAALTGNHAAHMILANLDAEPLLRSNVLSILSRTMVVTAHGQTNDLMHQAVPAVDEAAVDQVLEWKTAHYSFLNPIHVGMVLAGADCHATDAITPYALHTGKAFQIANDITGVFGHGTATSKNLLGDIREGKHTVLTAYALQHASQADVQFLSRMLGNNALTQSQFARCQDILVTSGARTHAQTLAGEHIGQAIGSLERCKGLWPEADMQFLHALAQYVAAQAE